MHGEYVNPGNQTSVEGFLLQLPDLSRGTIEAHLLLCGFLIDTTHKQSIPASALLLGFHALAGSDTFGRTKDWCLKAFMSCDEQILDALAS